VWRKLYGTNDQYFKFSEVLRLGKFCINLAFKLPVVCPSLAGPKNGEMSCSLGDDGVPSYDDTCSFTCNTGYERTGDDTRTCQSDGSWSGSDNVCRRGELCNISSLPTFRLLDFHIQKLYLNPQP